MKEHIKYYCYLYYEAVIYVSTTILNLNCKQKKLENYCLSQAGSLNIVYENPFIVEQTFGLILCLENVLTLH